MTNAQKCCVVLDYLGYEAHYLNDAVWITVWNRELTETMEFELSSDEVRNCSQDFDHEYKLHESFRKWIKNEDNE
tara:strand:+ start:250 stop:474 length:225 start_codon:yes stop_codon:yes gene_type:complete